MFFSLWLNTLLPLRLEYAQPYNIHFELRSTSSTLPALAGKDNKNLLCDISKKSSSRELTIYKSYFWLREFNGREVKCEKRRNHPHPPPSSSKIKVRFNVIPIRPYTDIYNIATNALQCGRAKKKKNNRKQFNYKTFSFTFLTNQPSFISKFIIKPVSSTETHKIHSPFAKLCFTAADVAATWSLT